MRINPIHIGINNTYNPVRWIKGPVRPQAGQTEPGANHVKSGQQQVNHLVQERYFRPQLKTPYQTTTTASAGQKALAAANFAAANMDIWKKIKKSFGIELVNTVEAAFRREEMEIIMQTLAGVPRKHLAGIKSIVKARGLGLEMELMHAKTKGKTVLGAYQKTQQRIYIFESCPLFNLKQTLLHEIGHAVHSYCASPKTILKTARKAGWRLKEFRPSYLDNNAFYPIVLQEAPVNEASWEDAGFTFSEMEIKKKRTADGRYVLEAPVPYKDTPEYKNPLETFACLYERQFS